MYSSPSVENPFKVFLRSRQFLYTYCSAKNLYNLKFDSLFTSVVFAELHYFTSTVHSATVMMGALFSLQKSSYEFPICGLAGNGLVVHADSLPQLTILSLSLLNSHPLALSPRSNLPKAILVGSGLKELLDVTHAARP